jgi:hypothetical protein
LCEGIAEAAVIKAKGYADPDLKLKTTSYLSDHYPECLGP